MLRDGSWRELLRLALLAFSAMLPAFFVHPGAGQSLGYNLSWAAHFGSSLIDGNLYPRWIPDAFEGLGSPTFYFYPPMAFWVTGLIVALGSSPLIAICIAGVVLLLTSGLAMRTWLNEVGGNATIGAAMFMLAPYHLYDFYVRGALGEFAAYVWLPLVALGIYKRRTALTAAAYAGLMLTHLPTAVLASVFLMAPLMIRHRSGAAGVLIGLCLAAFYLLPALTMQDAISVDALWSGHYRPSNWAFWEQLDSPSYFESRFLVAVGLVLAVLYTRSFWGVMALVSSLCALCVFPPMWDIPGLAQVQFPWRLLPIAEFAAITAIVKQPPPKPLAAAAAATFILPYASLISIAGLTASHSAQPYKEPPEYLPVGADLGGVDDQQRDADLIAYRSLPRSNALAVARSGIHRFGHSAFPIWEVESPTGQAIPSTGPVLTFIANRPGTYRVVRVWIWQEVLGAALSAIALARLLLSLSLRYRSRTGLDDHSAH